MKILASKDIISVAVDDEDFFRLIPKVCRYKRAKG